MNTTLTEPVRLDLTDSPCNASTVYSFRYTCQKAFDGQTGEYNEWSSKQVKPVKGQWIQVVLSQFEPTPVVKVEIISSYYKSK